MADPVSLGLLGMGLAGGMAAKALTGSGDTAAPTAPGAPPTPAAPASSPVAPKTAKKPAQPSFLSGASMLPSAGATGGGKSLLGQ